MMKVTAKHWPWIVTIFLTALFWLHTIRLNKEIDRKEAQIVQVNLDNQELKEITSKQGRTIQAQEVVITNNKESLSRLTDTIFDLKKKDERNTQTIAYYKGVTNTTVTKLLIPYLDSNRMKRFEDSTNLKVSDLLTYINDSTVTVPAPAKIDSPHILLKGTVLRTGFNLDSLSIPDVLQLRFVEKGGFLKRKTIEVQYFHTNPYVKTTSSNSAIYRPKNSFFKKVLLPVGIGLVGGAILFSK